ncbi:MAG: hypothetical protein F4X74_14205 [Acidimicrobiia bacterium]|nr:hypothetical protein [Acidimicrobiia bacterium]
MAFPTGPEYLDVSAIETLPPDPEAALLNGDLGHTELYGLRIQALYLQHAYRHDDLAGLSNARIEPAFHQVMVALQVLSKSRPRMILADEVGLGKTIEAGLILKELRARQIVDRVLIVVPASLQWQWQQELRSKFNEPFEVLDSALLKSLSRRGENPWLRHDNVITSLSLARREAHAELIVEAGWDLVVFDEAHRVRRSLHGKRVSATLGYQLADELKEAVDGMLLLTATPMQLHPYELYSLIELVEPGICDSFEQYEQNKHQLPLLAQHARDVQQWEVLGQGQKNLLTDFFRSHGIDLYRTEGRRSAMELLDRKHPFARTMIRNRKVDVGGFTKRDPQIIFVQLDDDELELYQDISNYLRHQYNIAQASKQRAIGFLMVTYQKMLASSSNAVRTALKRRIMRLSEKLGTNEELIDTTDNNLVPGDPRELSTAVEVNDYKLLHADHAGLREEIAVLQGLVGRLGTMRDTKAKTLVHTMLKEIPPEEKVIVFTQFLETQSFLQQTLRHHGYEVEVFNGRMNQQQKDEAVIRFRRQSQVLIATEAGGEGRNFQFAHVMVNYDLPWNPMKVEQRIGRLDRMGQKKDVVIYNLACAGTIEERILDVLHKRIRLFEESVGALDPILGTVEDDIRSLAFDEVSATSGQSRDVEAELEQRVHQARMLENEKQHLALDPATFRRDQANSLVDERIMAGPSDLQSYMERTLRYFGGRLTHHPDGGVGIYLSQDLQRQLGARAGSYRGVFDYREALEREDLEFLAFGQKLVDSIVDLPITIRPAVACHRQLSNVRGGPYLEVFYAVEADGPVRSGEFVHHLVSEDMNVSERLVTEMPVIGEPLRGRTVPDWVLEAMEASNIKLSERQRDMKARVDSHHRAWLEEEIDRARRIYRDRDRRLRQRIADSEARVQKWTASDDPREKRILPAVRGKLKADQQRLSRVEEDRDSRIRQLQSKRSSVSVRVLASAVVVGP